MRPPEQQHNSLSASADSCSGFAAEVICPRCGASETRLVRSPVSKLVRSWCSSCWQTRQFQKGIETMSKLAAQQKPHSFRLIDSLDALRRGEAPGQVVENWNRLALQEAEAGGPTPMVPGKSLHIPASHLRSQRLSQRSGENLMRETVDMTSYASRQETANLLVMLGARVLEFEHSTPDVRIPFQDVSASASFHTAGVSSAPSEVEVSYDAPIRRAVTAMARLTVPRKWLHQTPEGIDALLFEDVARQFGALQQNAAINGDGSEEPLGLIGLHALSSAGTQAVSIPTAGFSQTTALAMLQKLQAERFHQPESSGWICDEAFFNTLAGESFNSVESLVQYGSDGWPRMLGMKVAVHPDFPADKIILANWSELLFLQWGGLDVILDKFTTGTAQAKITAFRYLSHVFRNEAAFIVAK
jgi:hypothetical protein